MHPNPNSETIRDRLLRDASAIRTLLADPQYGGQVLECLPSGEYAWLRPEHHSIRIVEPVTLPHPDDDTRYDLTELGRRAVAEAALFGPWPTVAEASPACRVCGKPSPTNPLRDGRCIVCELLQPATCPACHQPQTSPSCAAREHWGC